MKMMRISAAGGLRRECTFMHAVSYCAQADLRWNSREQDAHIAEQEHMLSNQKSTIEEQQRSVGIL